MFEEVINHLHNLVQNEQFYFICQLIVIFYSITGWLVFAGINLYYGKMSNSWIKVYLHPKLAWFLFEIPNLLWAIYFLLIRRDPLTIGYALFIIHYINRAIIYPLRMNSNTPVPFQVTFFAFSFTSANGFLQGISNSYGIHTQFYMIGVCLFFAGMAINIHSDNILQAVRRQIEAKLIKQQKDGQKSTKKYQNIDKFLFKYISNPNYFGQILEWFGYYLVCGSFQALLFEIETISVLVSGAIYRNQWNKKNIPDYPQSRKAVIPYIL